MPLFSEHQLPHKVYNIALLDTEFRAEFGDDYFGVGGRKGEYVVRLGSGISDAKAAKAIDIALNHNPTALTPKQARRKATVDAVGTLHGKKASDLTLADLRAIVIHWMHTEGLLAADGTINTEGV